MGWAPGKSFAAPEQSGSPCALGTPTPAQVGHTSHSAAGHLERQEAAEWAQERVANSAHFPP